jgi:hypothetical protein
MDTDGFRGFLLEKGFTAERAEALVACAERFAGSYESGADRSPAEAFEAFSQRMIAEKTNSRENYYAIALYARFIRDNALLRAALERLDGSEVLHNLYRKAGEALGERRRDAIVAGQKPLPVGTPNAEKPAAMQAMLEKLMAAEPDACRAILASGLRDLPDEHYAQDKALFEQSTDIDEYLFRKKWALLAELEQIQREGALYWNQEITDEVLDFVRRDPEIGQGVRAGDVVYETKIPYQAKEYLAESDPDRKRYYYCHCPWVKESLRAGRSNISPEFCRCSAAYTGRPWEVIFGEKVRVDVVESVLKGDLRCRFAVHLPARAVEKA